MRWSKEKNFLVVTLSDFMTHARELVAFFEVRRSDLEVSVLSCEDVTTYSYSQVTLLDSEVEEALERRVKYSLEQITSEVMGRSFKLMLCIKSKHEGDVFFTAITWDITDDWKRLLFYVQGVSPEVEVELREKFACRSFWWFIGDGVTKPTFFNIYYSTVHQSQKGK